MQPTWINTCFSLITPEHGISVAMVYKLNANGVAVKVKGAGGVTHSSDKHTVTQESRFARYCYQSMTEDSFA